MKVCFNIQKAKRSYFVVRKHPQKQHTWRMNFMTISFFLMNFYSVRKKAVTTQYIKIAVYNLLANLVVMEKMCRNTHKQMTFFTFICVDQGLILAKPFTKFR